MTYDTLQYWRARAERLEAALKEISIVTIHEIHSWLGVANRMQRTALKALSEPPPAMADGHIHDAPDGSVVYHKGNVVMDADTARAWRESDGDHRGHVEDRK
jgi:hypothetical protein